jgi:hypothetical protein
LTKRPIFTFDNPHFHNLSTYELYLELPLQVGDILHPPSYSGDFMLVIEHAHAVAVNEYKSDRLMNRAKDYDAEVEWKRMEGAFDRAISSKWVASNCRRIPIPARKSKKRMVGMRLQSIGNLNKT